MKKRIAVIMMVGFAIVLGLAASLFAKNENAAKNSVIIIYGSRYGSTAQTGKWIAEGMEGKADVVSAADVGGDVKKAHGAVTPGGSSPKDARGRLLYEPVWKYLYTHPVERVGDPTPKDPDCQQDHPLGS